MLNKRMKKVFVQIVAVAMFSLMLVGCTDTESEYDKALKSGFEKYQNGEIMTEQEYNAVKDFNEWADKQGEKTYEEWDQ